MLFVVCCLDKPLGGAEIRHRVRRDHLQFVVEHQQAFRYGGPLLSESGQTVGSLMILEATDRAALDRLLEIEPYCKSGLFEAVIIRSSRQVVPETAPGLLAQELARESEMQSRQ
jgi:uncharacterized protein